VIPSPSQAINNNSHLLAKIKRTILLAKAVKIDLNNIRFISEDK